MKTEQWLAFQRSIDARFKVSRPMIDMAHRISATEGQPLTPAQFAALSATGTCVVLAGGRQFAFGLSRAGFKLFRVLDPFEPDPVPSLRLRTDSTASVHYRRAGSSGRVRA